MTDDTVVVIQGAFSDEEVRMIGALANRLDPKAEIAAGESIVEVGVDCGEGRTIRVRMKFLFDFIRDGVFERPCAPAPDIHSPDAGLG